MASKPWVLGLLSISGERYNKSIPHSATFSLISFLVKGSNHECNAQTFILWYLFFKLATWSSINDCSGEITNVRNHEASALANAGNWKHRDFHPHVARIAIKSSLLNQDSTISSWEIFGQCSFS